MAHLTAAVTTSSRRFEGRSFALTFARWSFLQALYWLGVSPHRLGRHYAPARAAGGRAKPDDGPLGKAKPNDEPPAARGEARSG